MSNWEIKKLGEVLKIQNGYAFNSKLFTTEKRLPLIRIRDIKNGISTETNFNGHYDKKYEVKNSIAADNEFLSVFSYPLIVGDPKTALKEPNNIVLTETLARKIFSVRDEDYSALLGKTLQIARDSLPYKITGICKDPAENSHLQFEILASYITLYAQKNPWKEAEYDWTDSDFWHYLQLKDRKSVV